jgi:hypothetical protein
MSRMFRIAAALVFAAAFVVGVADRAEAGQVRSPVPLRIGKVKVGDWALYKDDNGFIKETATELEEVEGDFIVHYTMETFDANGRLQQTDEVARFRTGELSEYAELVKSRAKVNRRPIRIAGREVMIYIASMPEEPPYEMWYSDDFGITGAAGMRYTLPTGTGGEMEDYFPIEVMDFGGQRDRFDIRRSVRVIQEREREREQRQREEDAAFEREQREQERQAARQE